MITKIDKEQIVNMHKGFVSIVKIATMFNVTPNRIRQIISSILTRDEIIELRMEKLKHTKDKQLEKYLEDYKPQKYDVRN